MKKTVLTLALLLVCALTVDASAPDTIIIYKDKKVEIKDRDEKGRLSIRVTSPQTSDSPAIVYEGRIASTAENGSYLPIPDMLARGLRISCPMRPHYAMFGVGFAMVDDHRMNVDPYRSVEIIFNFAEVIFPIYKNQLGITTGLGVNWRTIYFDGNRGLHNQNGITSLLPNPEGRNYDFNRLKTAHLTVPLLLEIQPFRNKRFYFSIGAEAGVKIFTAYKERFIEDNITYTNLSKRNKFNTHPLSFNLMAQMGLGFVGIYAKYSPIGVFQNGKGPEGNPFSVGANINF